MSEYTDRLRDSWNAPEGGCEAVKKAAVNILNNSFNEDEIQQTNDGVALTCIEHPKDFPWHFVHKLVNVMKRKAGKI